VTVHLPEQKPPSVVVNMPAERKGVIKTVHYAEVDGHMRPVTITEEEL
jgi:hypothetical protein